MQGCFCGITKVILFSVKFNLYFISCYIFVAFTLGENTVCVFHKLAQVVVVKDFIPRDNDASSRAIFQNCPSIPRNTSFFSEKVKLILQFAKLIIHFNELILLFWWAITQRCPFVSNQVVVTLGIAMFLLYEQ